MRKLITGFILLTLFVFSSCKDNGKHQAKELNFKKNTKLNEENAIKIIKNKYKLFKQSMLEDNADFFRNLYSKDAIFYNPTTTIVGNKAIRDNFETTIKSGIVIDCTPIELTFYGNSAFELGKAIIQKKDGKVIATERYIVIWKKEGNTWKIHRDIPIKTK